jgi:hypothetical protein
MNEVIPFSTVNQMVGVYQKAQEDITQAFAILANTQKALQEAFDGGYRMDPSRLIIDHRIEFTKPAKLMAALKKDAWRSLANKMELRRVMSVARCEQLLERFNAIAGGANLKDKAA